MGLVLLCRVSIHPIKPLVLNLCRNRTRQIILSDYFLVIVATQSESRWPNFGNQNTVTKIMLIYAATPCSLMEQCK